MRIFSNRCLASRKSYTKNGFYVRFLSFILNDAFKFRNNFYSDPMEVNKARSNQRLEQTLFSSDLSWNYYWICV